METIKPAEDGGRHFILRMYEAEGAQTETAIAFPDFVNSWVETNLLEEPVGEFHDTVNCTLQFHPFEIKTIMVGY